MVDKFYFFIDTWLSILKGAVVERKVLSTLKESKKRFSICSQCPELEKDFYTCNKCGCFMKIKTKFKKTSCPLNKW